MKIRQGVLLALVFAAMLGSAHANAGGPVAVDYGNGCVLRPVDRAATVDALRFWCTARQHDAIFRASPAGAVPTGMTTGWVMPTSPPALFAPGLWHGKTFFTGPNGGTLLNRTAIGDSWPATVRRVPSITDGKPCWAFDYTPSPTPPIWDEVREVVPGVWLGYSYWRGVVDTPTLLAFVLA